MSDIRVNYSGLIFLLTGLISVIPSFVFTIIVTRTLSPQEFGTWGLIISLITYPMILEPIISYWAVREIARGKKSGKTALASSGFLSIGGIFIYIVIAYYLGLQSDADQFSLILGFLLVPFMFLNNSISQINLATKPVITTYGILVLAVSKMLTSILFVYILEMSIMGVIIAMIVAYVVSISYLIISGRNNLRDAINKNSIKKWLKLFWVPIYPEVTSIILRFDVIIFTVITSSVIGIAFWSASLSMTVFAAQAATIAAATYPKLLKEGNKGYLPSNLITLLYFAIPLVALTLVFAKPGLFALNPIYEPAYIVVIFLTIQMFLSTLNRGVFQSFLIGVEKVDVNEKSTFMEYVKSKLFYLPTIRLIQTCIYIGILTIGLLFLIEITDSYVTLLLYWSFVWMVSEIPITIYFYYLVQKDLKLIIEKNVILKYVITGAGIFGILYFIVENFLVYKTSIYDFLPSVILLMIIGIGSYVIVTFLIDLRAKQLIQSIFFEIIGKNKNN